MRVKLERFYMFKLKFPILLLLSDRNHVASFLPHANEVWGVNFHENPFTKHWNIAETPFCNINKAPILFDQLKTSCTATSACLIYYKVLIFIFLKLISRYGRQSTLLFKQSVLGYAPTTTKFVRFVLHTWSMPSMRFQRNASKGWVRKRKHVASKFSLLIDRAKRNMELCSACVVIAKCVLSIGYGERNQAAAKKVHRIPRKMSMYVYINLFISTNCSQVCIFPVAFQGIAKYGFLKIPPVETKKWPRHITL
jgi:hypothetical protein